MDFVAAPQFGEILEQGKQSATNAVKTAVSDTANSVSGQIGLKNEAATAGSTTNTQVQNTDVSSVMQGSLDQGGNEQTREMVKDFYSPSMDVPVSLAKPQNQEEYETTQKLLKVRQSLHDETYYNPLFAYEHKKEERPAEVIEKEEQQKKMAELEQKKEDNNMPISVLRAQTSAEVKLAGAG